jgi:hypothetical protein
MDLCCIVEAGKRGHGENIVCNIFFVEKKLYVHVSLCAQHKEMLNLGEQI